MNTVTPPSAPCVSRPADTADRDHTHQLPAEPARELLIRAAGHLFAQHGYHATSMDQVSARAKVSKPVIYQWFSSKLDLYLAVLHHHLDTLIDSVQRALQAPGPPKARVHRTVTAFFDFVDHDIARYRLVFESDLATEPGVHHKVTQAIDNCIAAISTRLRDSVPDPHHARLWAVGVVGASQFAARYWIDAGQPIPKRDAIDTTAALCPHGISRIRHPGPLAGQHESV
ncbi:TetR/AcrR family transcriptional regulator [Nocardia gipuzkoensis]